MQFRCVDYLTGVTHLSYKVLMGPPKDGKAVHCCDPALSVLVTFGVSKRLLRSISLPYFLSRLFCFKFFQHNSKAGRCPLWQTGKTPFVVIYVYTKWTDLTGCYAYQRIVIIPGKSRRCELDSSQFQLQLYLKNNLQYAIQKDDWSANSIC